MNYYCAVFDKTIKNKSNIKHLQSLSHDEFRKCMRKNHTVNSPNFFDVAEIFNEYTTN